MPEFNNPEIVAQQALEQAALWFATIHDEDVLPASLKEFELWRQTPEHEVAWGKVNKVNQQFMALKSQNSGNFAAQTLTRTKLISRRSVLKSFAGISTIGLLGWTSWRSPFVKQNLQGLLAQYQTATGQNQQIVLADNSQVWLNTDSALDVHFDQNKRELALIKGEVYINTSADELSPSRPFSVTTSFNKQTLEYTALGTEFLVKHTDKSCQLQVYQGKVALKVLVEAQVIKPAETIIVDAGFSLRFDSAGVSEILPIAVNSSHWRQGNLVAEDKTLVDFVEELSRYRLGYIRVADEIKSLAVDGVYPAYDSDTCLTMLANSLPITISYVTPWWVNISAI